MNNHPRTRHRRNRTVTALVVALAGVLLLAACGSSNDDSSSSGSTDSGGSSPKIRVSSQDFSEQKTLAEAYGQYLKAKGFDVDVQDPIGTRTQILAAMKDDKLDLEIDYTGSLATELKGSPVNDPDKTYDALVKQLKDNDLAAAEKSEAADANALVALKSWAEDNDVTSISDLSKVKDPVTLGGAAECAQRPDCLKGYNGGTYDLNLKFKTVDYGPPLVEALKADEIQVAQYGSTAPEIAQGEIVELKDDKGLQSAQNVVPVYRSAVESDKLTEALNEVSAKLSTETLAEWNQATDVDKEDPADVAQKWLEDNGLL